MKGLGVFKILYQNKCIRESSLSEYSTSLYDAYYQYCQSNGRTPLAESTLEHAWKVWEYKRVDQGFPIFRNYVYVGIKLKQG